MSNRIIGYAPEWASRRTGGVPFQRSADRPPTTASPAETLLRREANARVGALRDRAVHEDARLELPLLDRGHGLPTEERLVRRAGHRNVARRAVGLDGELDVDPAFDPSLERAGRI